MTTSDQDDDELGGLVGRKQAAPAAAARTPSVVAPSAPAAPPSSGTITDFQVDNPYDRSLPKRQPIAPQPDDDAPAVEPGQPTGAKPRAQSKPQNSSGDDELAGLVGTKQDKKAAPAPAADNKKPLPIGGPGEFISGLTGAPFRAAGQVLSTGASNIYNWATGGDAAAGRAAVSRFWNPAPATQAEAAGERLWGNIAATPARLSDGMTRDLSEFIPAYIYSHSSEADQRAAFDAGIKPQMGSYDPALREAVRMGSENFMFLPIGRTLGAIGRVPEAGAYAARVGEVPTLKPPPDAPPYTPPAQASRAAAAAQAIKGMGGDLARHGVQAGLDAFAPPGVGSTYRLATDFYRRYKDARGAAADAAPLSDAVPKTSTYDANVNRWRHKEKGTFTKDPNAAANDEE